MRAAGREKGLESWQGTLENHPQFPITARDLQTMVGALPTVHPERRAWGELRCKQGKRSSRANEPGVHSKLGPDGDGEMSGWGGYSGDPLCLSIGVSDYTAPWTIHKAPLLHR